MTKHEFPSRGGSYERQASGKLKCVAETKPAEGRGVTRPGTETPPESGGGKNTAAKSEQTGKAAKSKE